MDNTDRRASSKDTNVDGGRVDGRGTRVWTSAWWILAWFQRAVSYSSINPWFDSTLFDYIPLSDNHTMSRSGPGPETAPEHDQNSRPRRTSTTRTFFDPSPSASAAGRARQPIPSSSTHTHNNINSHYHPKVGSSHSSQEPNPGSLQNISESESEDDEGDEMRELSKLEFRRAKNRLKQRNLRRESFPSIHTRSFHDLIEIMR